MRLPNSWAIRPLLILSLILLLSWVFTMDVITTVQAETSSSSFRDNCPRYPVCLMKNVTLNTKYGQVKSNRNMVFNWFAVYANGTVFFDAIELIPNAMEILLFQVQSYGNGTFDIQIRGPPAVAVDCQGCPVNAHLSANLVSGQGAELFLSGNMPSSKILTVNYTPFGGACVPACIGGSVVVPLFLVAGGIILLALLVFRPRVKQKKEEEEVLVTVGMEASE